MNKIIILNVLLVFAFTQAFAKGAIPKEAQRIIESYVENYCQYPASGISLEKSEINTVKIVEIPGYVPSVQEMSVELIMTYGNDVNTYEMGQILTLENKTGIYRIVRAQGSCETIIRHE